MTPAQQVADRKTGTFTQEVPAGHVDTGFDVGMAEQGPIHDQIDLADFARIGADQMRGKLGHTGAHAGPIGRQIERPKRTDLAITGDALVCFYFNHSAVEDFDKLAVGPGIASLLDRQVDLIDVD